MIVFNHSDNVIVSASVRDDVANGNGFGSLVQLGSGVLSLNASNTIDRLYHGQQRHAGGGLCDRR